MGLSEPIDTALAELILHSDIDQVGLCIWCFYPGERTDECVTQNMNVRPSLFFCFFVCFFVY